MTDNVDLRPPREVRLGSLLLRVSAGLGALTAVAAVAAWVHLAGVRGPYQQALVDAGDDFGGGIAGKVTFSFGYNLAVAIATVLVAALLATKIRLPSRPAQTAVWVVTGAAWLIVGCGLAGGPETASGAPAPSRVAQALQDDLVPGWYSGTNTFLALALLGCLTATAFLLLRAPAQEFYHFGAYEEVPK